MWIKVCICTEQFLFYIVINSFTHIHLLQFIHTSKSINHKVKNYLKVRFDVWSIQISWFFFLLNRALIIECTEKVWKMNRIHTFRNANEGKEKYFVPYTGSL